MCGEPIERAGGRAHERGHGPELRRERRAGAAEADGSPVAFPVGREGDDLPGDLLPPEGRELVFVADDHHRGSDPLRGSADAHPEAEHLQLARDGRDDAQGLAPAHPARHLDRLEPHALEPLGRHALVRPGDGLLETRRAAQAMADARRQVLELLPGALVRECLGQDLPAGLAVGGRQVLGASRRRGRAERESRAGRVLCASSGADTITEDQAPACRPPPANPGRARIPFAERPNAADEPAPHPPPRHASDRRAVRPLVRERLAHRRALVEGRPRAVRPVPVPTARPLLPRGGRLGGRGPRLAQHDAAQRPSARDTRAPERRGPDQAVRDRDLGRGLRRHRVQAQDRRDLQVELLGHDRAALGLGAGRDRRARVGGTARSC